MTLVDLRITADNVSASPALRRTGRRLSGRVEPVLWGVFGLALTGAIWYFLRAWDVIPKSGLPGPGPTFRGAVDLIGNQQFRTAYYDTIGAWAESLVLASVSAIGFGLAVGWVPWLARSFSTPM
ncbi:MAG: hypothetical protein ABIQ39_15470, partial [Ilumatobacteraceae bacterium]